MKIIIKWIGGKKYLVIDVETFGGKLELGTYDEAEAEVLLNELESAADELREFINK